MDATGIKKMVALGITAVVAVVVLFFLFGSVGYNYNENWQVHQSITGQVTVINNAGPYFNMWGHVWTYPRYVEYQYLAKDSPESPGDESIRVTFNDGGTAQVDVFVKVQTPIETEQRLTFHQLFRGSNRSIRDAVEAHLIACVKAAGPIMSSTENQTSRKAEFNQIVEEMLGKGLFAMRRQAVVLEDTVIINEKRSSTAEGVGEDHQPATEPVKVMATEVVLDSKTGEPKVTSVSPLKKYGMAVEQFSILETDYDAQTRKQFATKKESFLLAEQAKAEQQRAVQEKLRIRAEGESNVETIKQEGEKEKMKAVVSAEKDAEVAELAKKKAVTQAQQEVEVAQQRQKESEIQKQIAGIEADTAELKKAAEISAAEAKQKSLEIGGALSEEARLLATLKKERDIGVAEHLSRIATPGVIIGGGKEGEHGGDMFGNLMNLTLLKSLGIIDGDDMAFKPKDRRAAK